MFCGGFVLASAVNVAFLALLLLFAVVHLIDFETNLQVAQFHLISTCDDITDSRYIFTAKIFSRLLFPFSLGIQDRSFAVTKMLNLDEAT